MMLAFNVPNAMICMLAMALKFSICWKEKEFSNILLTIFTLNTTDVLSFPLYFAIPCFYNLPVQTFENVAATEENVTEK